MHLSRAPSITLDTFFVVQFSADYTTNISGFYLRQAQSGKLLTAKDELVTFVAPNLEPLRGYHVFMRALPRIMAERPNAEILLIGGHGTSYGAPPPAGTTWQSLFLDEVAGQIDLQRVSFVGHCRTKTTCAHCRFPQPMCISPIRLYCRGRCSKP